LKVGAIQTGKTYSDENGILRTVVEISENHRPETLYTYIGGAPEGPGVIYENNGLRHYDYLIKFAKWAKKRL